MLDFFKNYNNYKEMELNNSKNQVKEKLTLREKIVYCIMIIFCVIGYFLNFKGNNFLSNHTDLIILAILVITYGIMKLKKRK